MPLLCVCIRIMDVLCRPLLLLLHLLLLSLNSEAQDVSNDCVSAFQAMEVSESKVRLSVVHVESVCSPWKRERGGVNEEADRLWSGDVSRAGYLKLKGSSVGVSSPVESGAKIGTLNYITKVGLGTPEKEFIAVVDTGSDVAWLQCLPCSDCYTQVDPFFDPSNSSSFQHLTCTAPQCLQLPPANRACSRSGTCIYGLQYGDSSITLGDFAKETLSIGGKSILNYAFGCGHQDEGLFQGSDGLIGLGKGPLSFITQSQPIFNAQFAYCLPPPSSSSSSGYIEFGEPAHTSGLTAPLISNPSYPSFYFVKVVGMSLGSKPLAIAASGFTPLIDSGTVITRLPSSIYILARDAFRAATASLASAPSPSPSFLDTCYNLTNKSPSAIAAALPLLSFHLQNGLLFTVPPNGMLVQISNNSPIFCFAFSQIGDGDIGIIGNTQQQGSRFEFDVGRSTLSIHPHACA